MAPTWFVRRSPGGYETIDLEDPASDDGHGLRSILRAEELEKAMEGRQIRMALGCVSAFLGLWVVFRVWRDSYIRSRAEPRPNSRYGYCETIKALADISVVGYPSYGSSIQLKSFPSS